MVSEFFHFTAGRIGVNPSDSKFQAYTNNQTDDFISSWVAVNHMSKSVSITNAIEPILENYNFINLVGLDESLEALQMILGLRTSYILHISAKSSGGYAATGTKGE